ncbi:MAG: SDR family oxidoreductase, partial [Chloroflexi bacterium]|nr:SDR family oxidoreductase [Chloroflexota bacterium]
AARVAEEGARVLVMDRGAERAEDASASIGEAAVAFTGDVSKGEDVQAMFQAAVDAFGGVNIIYNNAGIGGREDNVRDCPEEVFDEIMAINLRGVWLGMKYGIPHLERAGGGSILSTASAAGGAGLSGLTAYGAAKGGVISLTRAAAGEFASSGIRINCICPGAIATRIGDNSPGPGDPDALERRRERNASVHPLGRSGEGSDIAQAALFLASDESSFMTGQAIVVDGGWTAVDQRWFDFTGLDFS